jgi:hypothetical protein
MLASVLTACSGNEASSPAAAPTALASDVLGLGLERPREGLALSRAHVDPGVDTAQGRFFSLGDRVLVFSTLKPQKFETLTFYLELERGPVGWEPRAVGVNFAFCVGRHRCEGLSGTVTVDQDDPQSLVVHAALRGKPARMSEKEFVQTFRIDLRAEFEEPLRNLAWLPGRDRR